VDEVADAGQGGVVLEKLAAATGRVAAEGFENRKIVGPVRPEKAGDAGSVDVSVRLEGAR
jgi:hypothetical protein